MLRVVIYIGTLVATLYSIFNRIIVRDRYYCPSDVVNDRHYMVIHDESGGGTFYFVLDVSVDEPYSNELDELKLFMRNFKNFVDVMSARWFEDYRCCNFIRPCLLDDVPCLTADEKRILWNKAVALVPHRIRHD